jgi:hypothetical protein
MTVRANKNRLSAWLYVSLTVITVVFGLGLITYCIVLQQNSVKTVRSRMADLFADAREENS